MNRQSITLAAITAALLSGCISQHTPDWVKNPKSAYPETSHLSAVGEGDTRRAAENAAAANLARIFEAHIESDERLIDRTSETQQQINQSTDYSSDINIQSAQTLYNIQHAESWMDTKGRIHAVAYLDRRETAEIYRGKIEARTERIHFLTTLAEQTNNPFKRYAALRTAVQLAAENTYQLRQLNVIHSRAAANAEPAYSENQIREQLTAAARNIPVAITIKGDSTRKLTAALETFITNYGFSIGSPAALTIDGTLSIQDITQPTAGMVAVRYNMNLQFKDSGATILTTLSEKGRESHFSLSEAKVRSQRTLEQAIKEKGAAQLDAFFNALIDQPAH